MRVMIAPDSFGETLTAVQAARALAVGWSAGRPQDDVTEVPQSDGGPGFVDVLAARGGEIRTTTVQGPLGEPVDARWLRTADSAFIEVAQACGLGLLGRTPDRDSSLTAHSRGVGELVRAALADGAGTIVVGLGGSSCTDGGRGMISELGGLVGAMSGLADVTLIAASDVENPLLGALGAAAVFGPQKGADASAVAILEDRNADWADALRAATGRDVASLDGAGAAGGIGAALLAVGAQRASGAELVADHTDQAAILSSSDLVLTGEGKFDSQSLRGKLISVIAAASGRSGVRTVVFAGQVTLDPAEIAAAGVSAAYSITQFAGSVELAMTDAGNQLTALATSVASAW